MQNPLLEEKFIQQLPEFSRVDAKHFVPAIQEITASAKRKINSILEEAQEPDWPQVFYPIETVMDQLEQVWSVISHLNAVCNTPDVREAYAECMPIVTAFNTWLGQHEKLYQATLALSQNESFSGLDAPRRKIIENKLRDFRLSGIALDKNGQQEYASIKEKLSELTTTFANNVLDTTRAYSLHVKDKAQLKGLSPMQLDAARELAESKNTEGYLFTLDIPSYLPFMQFCENRVLREQMYRAYVTRASELGPDSEHFDNSALIEEILALRKSLSALLEFDNYVEYSLATKMAGSHTDVQQFLMSLADKSVAIARNEFSELQAFAADALSIQNLEAWDVPFASEKLRELKYAISQEELKPYFPVDTVISGMFNIVNRLYGIRVEKTDLPALWNENVRFYTIYDSNDQIIAHFYFDLFAREGKRGGAWMADCKSRRMRPDGSIQLPVAFMVCNFTPPGKDIPSLLTHTEVTTLFHEFGHGLHHMLTAVNEMAVSGINGVPWDAVELPSQFLENWCWEPEAIAMISSHYQTGEVLPAEMLNKLLAAKNFQSAMQMVRQLEFALFDIQIHHGFGNADWSGVQAVLNAVRDQVAAHPVAEFNRFQHSFSHIFAGGYAAGYYSYKWAEVLSADAYSLFEEKGVFDSDAGQGFYRHILSCGGSEDPAVLFEKFRGRPASVDALLRHSGIAS